MAHGSQGNRHPLCPRRIARSSLGSYGLSRVAELQAESVPLLECWNVELVLDGRARGDQVGKGIRWGSGTWQRGDEEASNEYGVLSTGMASLAPGGRRSQY